MNQEQINQAFEGRWRIKGKYIEDGIILFNSKEGVAEAIKGLCRDFFTAGIMIGDKSCISNPLDTIVIVDTDKLVNVLSDAEALKMQHDILNNHDTHNNQKTSFDMWWDMYDLKCNRGGCEKKWNKMTAAEKYACVAATPAYVASTPEKQYRKRPLTFLNQKAWQDEIIIRNNPDSQRQQRLTASAELVARYAAEGNSPQSEVPEAD
jgi:hypothetical protein